ncbi:MAG: four-carbon acid sugar kinase family protein [Sporomusaceae bacterium]|nr:four-carbon acid sugar kinase family protein [Sporomusaceae bacterium]
MPQIAIIADDLTGATDTGVQFAKAGLRTHVMLGVDDNQVLPETADVVVVNTDSRSLAAAAAYEQAARAAKLIQTSPVSIIYKKIDSTLRGNLGAEIDAVLDQFAFDCAVIAPAFPQIGRITVGGYHLLHHQPLQSTEIALDGQLPLADSRLPAVLRAQSRYGVEHVELATVLAGEAAMRERLQACLAENARLISFDATDETHLQAIVQAMHHTEAHILWVGSAGLAECLTALCQPAERHFCSRPASGDLPVLVIAGSVSSVTAGQIQAFTAQPGRALVSVSSEQLLAEPERELERCVVSARACLRQRKHVAIVSSRGRQSVEQARLYGGRLGLDAAAVSGFIAGKLGVIARKLVDEGVEGVFVTGGDTAVSVCHALGAASMEICSEVAPGIPLCRLGSGKYAGLKVVTKAGAFGDIQAVNQAVAAIQNSEELNRV